MGEMRYWTHIIISGIFRVKLYQVHIDICGWFPGTASFLDWLISLVAGYVGDSFSSPMLLSSVLLTGLSVLLIRYSDSSSALGQLRYLGFAP